MATNTEKQKARKRRPRPDGSPITIGGGGGIGDSGRIRRKGGGLLFVTIDFDHNDYVPDPNDQSNFKDDEYELGSLYIDRLNPAVNPDSEVKVFCNKSGTSTIRIKGRPLGVKFRASDFPYDQGIKEHFGDGRQIVKVTVDGKTVYEFDPDNPVFVRKLVAKSRTARKRSRRR